MKHLPIFVECRISVVEGCRHTGIFGSAGWNHDNWRCCVGTARAVRAKRSVRRGSISSRIDDFRIGCELDALRHSSNDLDRQGHHLIRVWFKVTHISIYTKHHITTYMPCMRYPSFDTLPISQQCSTHSNFVSTECQPLLIVQL